MCLSNVCCSHVHMQVILCAAYPHLLSAATSRTNIDDKSHVCHFPYKKICQVLTYFCCDLYCGLHLLVQHCGIETPIFPWFWIFLGFKILHAKCLSSTNFEELLPTISIIPPCDMDTPILNFTHVQTHTDSHTRVIWIVKFIDSHSKFWNFEATYRARTFQSEPSGACSHCALSACVYWLARPSHVVHYRAASEDGL